MLCKEQLKYSVSFILLLVLYLIFLRDSFELLLMCNYLQTIVYWNGLQIKEYTWIKNNYTYYMIIYSIMMHGPAVRVFANGPGDLGSIPGRVIPKTLKMELDTTLLNTQHYKVRFKGKVEQSREWSSALPYTLV